MDLSKNKNPFGFSNKLYRVLWIICHLFFFRPFPTKLFRIWRVLVLKLFGAKVDWTADIYSSVKIWSPKNLQLGRFSTLGPMVDCYNQGYVSIGNNVVISQKTYICASSHSLSSKEHKLYLSPIDIGDSCWIAADAFIGPGVTIGEGAVVGARSSVFDKVEDYTVVRGNPATFFKYRIIR